MSETSDWLKKLNEWLVKMDPLQDGISSIQLIDYLGGDLEAVNGARASFGNESEDLQERDIKLLQRLGRDQHHTPLRHVYIQLHIKAPEFVARQWYKHVVGCEYSFKDLPWSEFSQRYKEVKSEFYVPKMVRGQHLTNKQASIPGGVFLDELLALDDWCARIEQTCQYAFEQYDILVKHGVAREQARLVLPMATYTEWTWTASIQACVHFAVLRNHSGAQWEIQEFAKALTEIVRPIAPHTWDTLFNNHSLILASK